MLECIEKSDLKDSCEIIENDSGLHFLLKLHTDMSDIDFVEALMQENIRIKAISEYFRKSEKKGEHIFLLNYSNINIDKLLNVFNVIYQIQKYHR